MSSKKARRIISDEEDEGQNVAGPSRSPAKLPATPDSASSGLTPPPTSPAKPSTAAGIARAKEPSDADTADAPKHSLKLKLKRPAPAAEAGEAAPLVEEPTAPPKDSKRPRPSKRNSIVPPRTMQTRSQSPEKRDARRASPSKLILTVNAAASAVSGEPTSGGLLEQVEGVKEAIKGGKGPKGARGKGEERGKTEDKTGKAEDEPLRPEGKAGKPKKRKSVGARDRSSAEAGAMADQRIEDAADTGAEMEVDGSEDLFGDAITVPPEATAAQTQDQSGAPLPNSASTKDPSKKHKPAKFSAASASSTDPSSHVKKRRLSSTDTPAKSTPRPVPSHPSPALPAASTPGPSLSTEPKSSAGISTDPKKPAAAVQPKKSLPNLKKRLPGGTPGGTPSRPPVTATTSLLSSTLASLTKVPSTSTPGKKEEKKPVVPPATKTGGWDEEWILTPKEEALYAASAPQRAKEREERARWRINPINLQEGKDAYRLDAIRPRAIHLPHADKHPNPHGLITTGGTNRLIKAWQASRANHVAPSAGLS